MNPLQVLPPTLPGYNNPCWYEQVPRDFQYTPYGKNDDFTAITAILGERCNKTDMGRGTAHVCWRIRCFPYFFLLGVAKCGTTDIYNMLKLFHPGIVSNSFKEPYYWGYQRRNGKYNIGIFSIGGMERDQISDIRPPKKIKYPILRVRKNQISG